MAALLIDDDARLGALVTEYLGRHEIDVTVAGDGERGLSVLRKGRFDVVLLDVMLPGADGFEVCRRLRAAPELAALPVLMLTARGDDVDKVVDLELGADDYLAKPFNPRELLARIRAVLRRAGPVTPARARLRTGGLEVDFDAREGVVDRRRVELTHYEFELLAGLATAAAFAVGTRGAMMQELGDRVARHLASDVADVVDKPDALGGRLQRIHDDVGVAVTVRDPHGHMVAASGRSLPHRGWSATAPI